MNTSKLILPFSCGKVNFSRSILLLKKGFCMSEEMEVACLWCLSDDKLPAETFWVICQMTNHPQRRFGTSAPSTLRKMTIWEHLHSVVFAWKGIFMDCHADARNDGWSPLWLRLVSSLNFTNSLNSLDSPLLEEWNRRGFSSVA